MPDKQFRHYINKKGYPRLKLLILLFVVGGISFLINETGLIHFFLSKEKMIGFIHSLGPVGFIGFILPQIIQVVAAPIAGEVTSLLGCIFRYVGDPIVIGVSTGIFFS